PKMVLDRFFPDAKALYIQSTVGISPGDSGGALVNESGELVGLNFAGSNAQNTSFHVHLSEVKAFLANIPSAPEYKLPSAWLDVANYSIARMADSSFDGVIDTLQLATFRDGNAGVTMFDLAQTTFTRGIKFQNQADMLRRHGFHADFAFMKKGGDAYA